MTELINAPRVLTPGLGWLNWCNGPDHERDSNTGDTVAITLHAYGADLTNGTSVRRTYRQRPEDAAS